MVPVMKKCSVGRNVAPYSWLHLLQIEAVAKPLYGNKGNRLRRIFFDYFPQMPDVRGKGAFISPFLNTSAYEAIMRTETKIAALCVNELIITQSISQAFVYQ